MSASRRIGMIVALVVLAAIAALAVAPQLFATHDPLQTDVRAALLPPSAEHFFGTDQSGRDVYSRVVYGTGRSVGIGVVATALAFAVGLTIGAPGRALAHCDGLDGPVVRAAQEALDSRNPALALMWVQPKDEPEIRTAFEQALAVRALSPQARRLADRFFFETLVRVHRAGEGAPFTGLKPAGRDLGPAIPVADRAIKESDVELVVRLLTQAMQARLREHFEEVVSSIFE